MTKNDVLVPGFVQILKSPGLEIYSLGNKSLKQARVVESP